MKIEKYKYLGNSKYKVFIDNDCYLFYEDVIVKYNFLLKDNITKKELDKYLDENSFYEYYYLALKYINTKLRTKKEVEKYLLKQEISKVLLSDVIKKLCLDGYLNEDVYAECYINDQINLKVVGPKKIENDLINLGISKDVIDRKIVFYTKEMMNDKIVKYIDKQVRLNSNKSLFNLKNKILQSLLEKGFYKEDIMIFLDEINIDEKEIYKKEYQKIYDKLSKKYNGSELLYKIKDKMYQKGFNMDNKE